MPKSRQRKDHKKKVKQRNDRIKDQYRRATKEAWDKFEKHKQEQVDKDDFQYPEFK